MAVQLGSAYGQIILDASGVDAGARQAQGILGGLESSMSRVGGTLTRNVTLPLVGIGVAAAKVAIDMDAAMRNIQSISKATDAEIEALSDEFVNLSTDMTKTTDSAIGLAEGFYNIQGSGFEGAAAMEVLLASTKAASAGLTETEVAARAITAKLNAYGESAEEAAITSDLMFRTVDRGVGSFEELAGSLSSVVGTAANAGIEFDTVSAALSTMSKQGISFAEGGVALNQLILSLIDPSDELAGIFQKMGYESGQAALQSLGLVGTLNALAEAGYSDTASLAPLLGNVRALRAALALGGEGAGMFAEDLEAMAGAAGAAEEAFAIQTKSARAQLLNLRNEAIAAGIDLGGILVPALMDVVGVVRDVLAAFRSLPEPVQENIVRFALLAAAIGPAMKVGSGLVGTFKSLVGGARILMAVLPGLAGALGPLAAAAIAMAAAYMKWQDTQKMVAEGTRQVGNAWGDFFDQQVAGGASAAEVLEAYRAKQVAVKEALDEGGAVADIFIRNQKELTEDVDGLQMALAKTATGWEEFTDLMGQAGLEVSLTREQFEALRNETTALDQAAGAVQGAFAGVVEGALGVASAVGEMELGETGRTLQEVAGAAMELQDILGLTETAFQAAGMEGEMLDQRLERAAVTLGAVSEAEAKVNSDMRLLTAAFAEGSLSTEAFARYAEQAQAGTLNLSSAQIAGISAAMEHARAQREAAAASDEYRLSLLSQSEALKDVGAQQAAQIALKRLQEDYSAGLLSLDAYEAAVISVQDAYGLATPQSRALAMGIEELNGLLVAGRIAPDDYAAAVEAMRSAAEGGEDSVEGLMGAVEDAVGPIEEGTGAVGGLGSEADAAATKMDRMAEAARRAKGDLEAMTATDWIVNVGTAGTLPPGVTAVRLQTGAWEIPALTLALLHPGEMVLPAEVAETLRGMTATPAPVYPAPSATGGGASTTYVTVEGDTFETTVNDRASAALLAAMMAERKRDRLNAFMGG